jgi:hypothetical protein
MKHGIQWVAGFVIFYSAIFTETTAMLNFFIPKFSGFYQRHYG